MLVLKIIAVLLAIALVAWLVKRINTYGDDHFKYEPFSLPTYIINAIGYTLIYFGYKWYNTALATNGDILNGILVIFFGVLFIIVLIAYNIANSKLGFGLLVSLLQMIIYAPLTIVGLYALLLAFAFFAQTKPVYSINGDD